MSWISSGLYRDKGLDTARLTPLTALLAPYWVNLKAATNCMYFYQLLIYINNKCKNSQWCKVKGKKRVTQQQLNSNMSIFPVGIRF